MSRERPVGFRRFDATNGYWLVKIEIGWMPEHDAVWCRANGLSRLPNGFVVHHKNEDKQDNRLENLQLMTKAAHARLHTTGRTHNASVRSRISEAARRIGADLQERQRRRKRATEQWRTNPPVRIGDTRTPEQVERIRSAVQQSWDSGRNKGMTGKRHSSETRQKMREAALRREKRRRELT